MIYNRAEVEDLVRNYADLLSERDDKDIHDRLLDFEHALMSLDYNLVMPIYNHGCKGLPLRIIEQRTGVNRETLRKRFYKGIDELMRMMNEQT